MNKQAHIEDILRAPREDLIVNAGETVHLDTGDKQYVRAHHLAAVRTFEDLRALSLISSKLSERLVREAIAGDDEEALSLARAQPAAMQHCSGTCGGDPTGKPALRSTYTAVRRTYNPRLAKVMTAATGVQHEWHDLLPATVRGWISRTSRNPPVQLLVWVFADVVIKKNGILSLSNSSKHFNCGALRIHTGGKLVGHGSMLKIRCASAVGNLP